MLFERQSLVILEKALQELEAGFELPALSHDYPYEAIERVLHSVVQRLRDNYPYFHPLYAGQMLKPPHPLARAAYMLAMWINPNNHALDGGRASSAMEKEVVRDLAAMFGWETHLGHLTGGGTMANLEALWVSGQLHPGKLVVASEFAHYTHQRISGVLQLPFRKITGNARGEMDLVALELLLEEGQVGTVVVTLGATGTGAIDPLSDVLQLQKRFGFRIHVDAAYGGYFGLADNLTPEARRHFDSVSQADSIVIDPHKHGLQPYGCGCVLFKDPAVSKFYLHDSPYTYYSSSDIHLGEISLECSRPGAAAVGLWATHQLLPPVKGGVFAADISTCRSAALEFYDRLKADPRFLVFLEPQLDIVIWALPGQCTSEMSAAANRYFHEAENRHLYLSLFKYPAKYLAQMGIDVTVDSEYLTCLRSCLMKPEHGEWLEVIWGNASGGGKVAR